MDYIENRTLEELAPGDSAEMERALTAADIELFAVMSGDVNPAHLDTEYAESGRFHRVIAHGMWGGALISAVLGTRLPGPGTVYLGQSLALHAPVGVGDVLRVRVEVLDKDMDTGQVRLSCTCTNQRGEEVITGEARVQAPRDKVRRPRAVLPEVTMHRPGARFRALVAATADCEPIATAVVHPCDALSLSGALSAAEAGIMRPILVGPRARIAEAAEAGGLDLTGIEQVDTPHSHASAEASVALVQEGQAEALMKGKLHTDELLSAVLRREGGLRTERRLSHVFALDVPSHPRTLFVTDAAINISPDLACLRDIVQNAIDLVRALGTECPRVAILSAVETVTGKLPSTLHAAALCKMHERGQIEGGLIDGPLAFDTDISAAAARAKGIVSQVAGQPDILVAPNLESGNMIAKQLIYLAGAESAGIALGARVPIMLTSRADSADARLASAALAQLFIRNRRGGPA
ncbi:MAG: bifunctional enoyl-CoA hydratase/phosphate acetyltransferase [Rhodobacteraceae bacterium]|nr:bifunctional enoyl-CoA hydratase/phosphate acetyltransferase [Paracoccaceae bacterium]